MKRSNRLVILVGVLLAILAFVAIVILLNQQQAPVAEEEVRETVLVAAQDIEIGESITPELVEEVQVELEAVLQTPIRSRTQVSGQPALFPIPAGSQVTAEAIGLGTGAVVNIAARLNPGEKAITFSVDDVTGVGLLIKEGDTVDIVVSEEVPAVQETADSAANPDEEAPPRFEPVIGLENQRSVKTLLQDKRILYVGQSRAQPQERQDTNNDGVINEQDEPPPAAPPIIVFAGTDQDAEIIKFAQGAGGSISALIRHADDDEIEETTGITLRQLVDEYGLLIPNIIQLEFEGTEENE